MMRQPLRANAARRAVSRPLVMPSPVKGWMPNLPLTNLPADAAALLDNWFCEADGVRPRGGSVPYVEGLGATVESLMSFVGAGSSKLLAAAGSNLYDVTTSATATTPVLTGLGSAQWQSVNMATSGGPSLLGFNGVDLPFRYNGATFTAPPYTPAALDPAFAASKIIQGEPYATRLFLVLAGSTAVLYTAPDTFQGEVGRLEVGASFPRGGEVQALSAWTQDTGQGPDDMLVIVSSEGDIVVYSGTNPSDAASWDRVGTYQTARPIGRRCLMRLGGDLAILTVDGVKKMSRIVTQDSGVNEQKDPFYNVNPAIRDSVLKAGSRFGWGLFAHRDRSMLIVNAPRVSTAVSNQYVMNIGTQAWARWTGLNAACLISFGGELYFGAASGRIMKAETGYGDNGRATFCPMVTGFTAAGSPGAVKQAKLIKAIITATVQVSPLVGVCTDYRIALPGSLPSAELQDVARWDSARFDLSRWASGRFGAPHQDWAGAEGVGFAFAAAASLSLGPETPTGAGIKLQGFQLLAEPGNGLL